MLVRLSRLLRSNARLFALIPSVRSPYFLKRSRELARAMNGKRPQREIASALRRRLVPDNSPLGYIYKRFVRPPLRMLLNSTISVQSSLTKQSARSVLAGVALIYRASPRLGRAVEARLRSLQRRRHRYAAHTLLGPLKFVPHDADLFLFFNSLVGEMYFGRRVYPIFCCHEARSANAQLKHFAYLHETCPNSWMEFFEPIAYAPGDDLHSDMAKLLAMPCAQGHLAAPEFRCLKATQALYGRSDYQDWRWAVHNSVVHMIKPTSDIRANIDSMLKRMSGHRLGVHVPHPSHFEMQGKTFLEPYFVKIDSILEKYSDSNIFLATDNDLVLAGFRERYGSDRVLCHPRVICQMNDEVLARSYSLDRFKNDENKFGGGIGSQGQSQIAATGGSKEGIRNCKAAITDVFTLAACDDFVCSASNFTLACAYLNPRQVQHIVPGE